MKRNFIPIQPTFELDNEKVQYLEQLPNNVLANFIHCFWELKSIGTLESEFNYRVVTDGCIDILFDLHNSEQIFIIGFSNSYKIFQLPSSFHYFGIRLLPGAFTKFFNIPAIELTNKMESLQDVLPAFQHYLKSKNAPLKTVDALIEIIEDYFLKMLASSTKEIDSRFMQATSLIYQEKGDIRLQRDMQLPISERQLLRIFKHYVGTGPKEFAKVVQFQNLLLDAQKGRKVLSEKAFFEHGFYDQSHFIKDFKWFYGDNPSAVL